jgi:glycosyltransferase involved in cell wall biosynthesis
MGDRPRVVYWFTQPTPYVVARFNALADSGQLDFEAWFSEVRQADRSWDVDEAQWRFRASYIPARRLLGLRIRVPIPELLETRPDLFVLEYDRLNLALGTLVGRALSARLGLRILPNYDSWSRRTWWREASKRLLFRAVDGAKVPGRDGSELAKRYGVPAERIYSVRQSVDVAHYGAARKMPDETRRARREELGLSGCVFMFVGRLWRGKGLDDLMAAYASLSELQPESVSLLVVGDGSDESRYRALAAQTRHVVMAGFVQPADLPSWYAVSDCLVFPTHGDPNGLVVEEALAAGLPVISTESAGDIRVRLGSGSAGVVVPTGSPLPLANAMLEVASNHAYRQSMKEQTWSIAERMTDADYARDFVSFAEAVLHRRGNHLPTTRHRANRACATASLATSVTRSRRRQ